MQGNSWLHQRETQGLHRSMAMIGFFAMFSPEFSQDGQAFSAAICLRFEVIKDAESDNYKKINKAVFHQLGRSRFYLITLG